MATYYKYGVPYNKTLYTLSIILQLGYSTIFQLLTIIPLMLGLVSLILTDHLEGGKRTSRRY